MRHLRPRPEGRTDDPDLVLSGTIRRFGGWSHLHPLGILATAAIFPPLLGVPVYVSDTEVDLELTLARPDGAPVATYASQQRRRKWSSLYTNPLFGIGSKLNEDLSAAVADMRQQMLADRERLLRGIRDRADPGEPPPSRR